MPRLTLHARTQCLPSNEVNTNIGIPKLSTLDIPLPTMSSGGTVTFPRSWKMMALALVHASGRFLKSICFPFVLYLSISPPCLFLSFPFLHPLVLLSARRDN